MPGFNANEYTTVAERLTRAKDDLQTIVAEPPVMLTDVMGYIRATVALKDGRTSTGTASFRLDLTGGRAQATNPIEDCETSAIGRALGMLGYGSTKSVASREEMHEAERRQQVPARPARTEYVPTEDNRPPASSMRERQQKLADLRTSASKAGIKYAPPKLPTEMSALELDAAINALEMLLQAAPA